MAVKKKIAKKKAKKDTMETLFPGEYVTLENGDTVNVSPVPFGKLKIFGEAITKLLVKIQKHRKNLQDVETWGILFEIAFEETIEIMCLVLKKDRAFFDIITIGDGIALASKMVEQNYTEDAKKKIQGVLNKITLLSQIPSSTLLPKGIDGKK
jgi:hypothetical protein